MTNFLPAKVESVLFPDLPFPVHVPPRTAKKSLAVDRVSYVRQTIHPNDPDFRERAVAWGRRSVERESVLGHGSIIPFGWIKHSEQERVARLGDDDRREAERRRLEDARIVWTQDDPGEWCL